MQPSWQLKLRPLIPSLAELLEQKVDVKKEVCTAVVTPFEGQGEEKALILFSWLLGERKIFYKQ